MNWSTGTWSWGNANSLSPGPGMVSAISEAEMIQEGKHPGKTNLTDVDNALNILKFLLDKPAAVIVKHNNPCGVAYGASLSEAYFRANRADRIAAFGGAAVFNRPVDKTTAELIARNYLEVVAAPDFEEGAVSHPGQPRKSSDPQGPADGPLGKTYTGPVRGF